MKKGLRIVFTGRARVRERRVTSLLALQLAKERGVVKENLTSSDLELETRVAQDDVKEIALAGRDTCLELILTEGGREIEVFLDSRDSRRQVQEWRDAFKRILERAEENPQRHVFVSMHGVYHRKTRFFSLLDFDLIRQFNLNPAAFRWSDANILP